ncbi:MAG: PKD domain-containing protein [bacterium]
MMKTFMRRASLLPLLAVLLQLCACSTGSTASQNAALPPASVQLPAKPAPAAPVSAPAAFSLPDPASLLPESAAPRTASYSEGDLLREGADYDTSLPSSHVSLDGASLLFSPDTSDVENPGIAYAIYHYSVPGYDRAPELRMMYDQGAEFDNFWLALANWNTRRWDFYKVQNFDSFVTSGFGPYLDLGGNLLAAIVVHGEPELLLGSLRLGPYPPVVELSADPAEGDVPFTTTLDASASQPVEGSTLSFSWDLDGDGIFESDTGSTPQIEATYNDNGVYIPRVRATNSAGVSAERTVYVTAYGSWSHTWGRGDTDEFADCVEAADGTAYVCGTSRQPDFGGDYDAHFSHWSTAGELLWAKRFDSGTDDLYHAIAQDSAGDLVLCGQTGEGPDVDGLVQKFAGDGSMIWSRSLGGAKFDNCEKLLLDGTDIYIAGTSSSLSGSSDIFLLKLDADGNLLWQAARDNSGAIDGIADLDGSYTLLSGLTTLIVLCKSSSGGVPNCWKLSYGTDGSFNKGQMLQGAQYPKSEFALLHERNVLTNEIHNYIAGQIIYEGTSGLFISNTDGSGADLGFAYFPDTPERVSDIITDPDGNLLLLATGSANGDGALDLAIYQFTKQLNLLGSFAFMHAGGAVRGQGLAPFREGFLLCGYAPDLLMTLSEPVPPGQILTIGFDDNNGSAMAINWSMDSGFGIVDEVAQQGVLDSGAGGSDGLLCYLIP